ncbi:MAG: hypothetical protein K8R59_07165 [Thermoanaerobaculales bacterium]|nr:hypothetical protein [Thermoanaerobaculales bacterium]
MKPRLTIIILCMALPVAVQVSAEDVFGAIGSRVSRGRAGSGPGFTWQRDVKLDRITLRELLPSRSGNSSTAELALNMGAWREGASICDVSPVTTTLMRTIPSLWRMKISNAEDNGALDVSYEIKGANGRHGILSNDGRSDSEIRVATQPLAPIITEYGDGSNIVEGGVVLYLDIANARSAGRYSGTITVTVHHL